MKFYAYEKMGMRFIGIALESMKDSGDRQLIKGCFPFLEGNPLPITTDTDFWDCEMRLHDYKFSEKEFNELEEIHPNTANFDIALEASKYAFAFHVGFLAKQNIEYGAFVLNSDLVNAKKNCNFIAKHILKKPLYINSHPSELVNLINRPEKVK